jgi:hypothetical protein
MGLPILLGIRHQTKRAPLSLEFSSKMIYSQRVRCRIKILARAAPCGEILCLLSARGRFRCCCSCDRCLGLGEDGSDCLLHVRPWRFNWLESGNESCWVEEAYLYRNLNQVSHLGGSTYSCMTSMLVRCSRISDMSSTMHAPVSHFASSPVNSTIWCG